MPAPRREDYRPDEVGRDEYVMDWHIWYAIQRDGMLNDDERRAQHEAALWRMDQIIRREGRSDDTPS